MGLIFLPIVELGKNLADFLFPRECLHCGKLLNTAENFLCENCSDNLTETNETLLCSEYERKFLNGNIIKDFYSAFVFVKGSPIQSLIHGVKYGGKFGAGKFLGEIVARKGKNKIEEWNADFIVPVPLHPVKKAMRGYNQSFYLAKGVSENSAVKVNKVLVRKKFTISQTTLSKKERERNVSDAFGLKRFAKIGNEKIILIDDVITTGSTVLAAAKILKDNGAKEIFALSVAIAQNPAEVNI